MLIVLVGQQLAVPSCLFFAGPSAGDVIEGESVEFSGMLELEGQRAAIAAGQSMRVKVSMKFTRV